MAGKRKEGIKQNKQKRREKERYWLTMKKTVESKGTENK